MRPLCGRKTPEPQRLLLINCTADVQHGMTMENTKSTGAQAGSEGEVRPGRGGHQHGADEPGADAALAEHALRCHAARTAPRTCVPAASDGRHGATPPVLRTVT